MSRNEATDAARILLWLLVALILAFAVLGIVMSFAMGWTGWTGHGMMGFGFGGMGFLMAIPVIAIVLILLVVLGTFDRTYPPRSSAMEVLRLRLARGEITLEEYTRLEEELRR